VANDEQLKSPGHCTDRFILSFSASYRPRTLGNDFPSIELDQHGSISLEILDRNGETKVV
jgi:hypothetical protein